MSGAPDGVVVLTEMDGVGTGTGERAGYVHIHHGGISVVGNSLWTVMVVEVEMEPLRVAVQVYCPA